MPLGSWWMKQNTHLFAQVAMSPGFGAVSSSPRSGPRRTRRRTRLTPSRSTESSRRASPAWNWKSIASRSAWPLTVKIRSPAARPAAAAGVRGRTAAIVTALGVQGAFTRLLPLLAGRRVQEAHAVHDVLEAGDHRERGREPEHWRGGQSQVEV